MILKGSTAQVRARGCATPTLLHLFCELSFCVFRTNVIDLPWCVAGDWLPLLCWGAPLVSLPRGLWPLPVAGIRDGVAVRWGGGRIRDASCKQKKNVIKHVIYRNYS